MRRSGTGNGGGLGMNKVVTGKSPKVEPRSQAIRPAGVAQIGLAVDPKAVAPIRGGRTLGPVGPTNNMVAGPGAGRTVHKSGSQHGLTPARPLPAGRSFDD
jgi:hypothetical protein